MTDEVHVTTSQADAAKLIVERNSANGKPTPEAIRKIAEAQVDPAPGTPRHRQARAGAGGGRRGRFRGFWARMSSRGTAPREAEGTG